VARSRGGGACLGGPGRKRVVWQEVWGATKEGDVLASGSIQTALGATGGNRVFQSPEGSPLTTRGPRSLKVPGSSFAYREERQSLVPRR